MKRFIPITTACAMLFSMAAANCADQDIRGMFVEQEHNQTAKKNTGVCYWLELKRKDQSTSQRCTNKTVFHAGDKIRIHMKPNVDGYAYIVMLEGSKGDKSVLFPSEDLGSNKVKAGSYITLPVAGKNDSAAWLKFDKNPGTEMLRMIVSRNKINPDEQLHDGSVVIADSESSSDKIPDGTLVSITVSKGNNLKSGLRNLVIDHDAKPQNEGETTVVGKANESLAVDIALKHSR